VKRRFKGKNGFHTASSCKLKKAAPRYRYHGTAFGLLNIRPKRLRIQTPKYGDIRESQKGVTQTGRAVRGCGGQQFC